MKHKKFNDRIQLIWLGRSKNIDEQRLLEHDYLPLIEKLQDDIQSSTTQLQDILSRFNPSEILPLVVLQNMARTAHRLNSTLDSNSPAFIEHLTAIALKTNGHNYKHPDLQDVILVRDLVERIFWLSCQLFGAQTQNDDHLSQNEKLILEQIYTNYLLVRGETYDTNFLKAALKLFDSQSAYLENRKGFNIRQAIGFTRIIIEIIDTRLNKENETFVNVFKKLASFEKTTSIWPSGVQSPIRNRRFVINDNLIPENLNEFAEKLFLISKQELLNLTNNNDRNAMSSFLEWISISPGEVSEDFVYPSHDNPIQRKPIVCLGQNYLLCACAYMGRCLFYRLDKELMNDTSYSEKYNYIRARYLENESLSIFKKIFPTAEIYNRLKYKATEDGITKNWELDGLVKHDNNIFLVECASHLVRKATKRGAKEQMIYDVKQTIERTYIQAERAKTYIQSYDKASFSLKNGSTVIIDRASIKNYYLISVTLDSYGSLVTDPRKLKDLGLFKNNKYPWPIYIENLKLISDYIEYPSEFVHYLRKRKNVAENIYAYDESDYFGCYLLLNLDIPMPTNNIEKVFIVSATNDFEDYFYFLAGSGPRVPKPRQYLPINVRNIILTLERLHPPGYTDVVCALLDIILPTREKIEEFITSALTRSKENGGAVKDFTIIDKDNKWGLTYFCGNGAQKENAERLMCLPEFCMMKIEQTGILSWIGLANDTSLKSPIASIFFNDASIENRPEETKAAA